MLSSFLSSSVGHLNKTGAGGPGSGSMAPEGPWLLTVTTEGFIRVWELAKPQDRQIQGLGTLIARSGILSNHLQANHNLKYPNSLVASQLVDWLVSTEKVVPCVYIITIIFSFILSCTTFTWASF